MFKKLLIASIVAASFGVVAQAQQAAVASNVVDNNNGVDHKGVVASNVVDNNNGVDHKGAAYAKANNGHDAAKKVVAANN